MIEKTEQPQPISGTLELAPPPTAGSRLHLRGYLVPAAPDVETQPFIRDDTGMLLSVCSIVKGSVQALGTGFLVAPGLAMTSTHVISAYHDEGRLEAGTLLLIGTYEGRLRAWQATAVKLPEDGDVTLVEMVPRFLPGDDVTINHVELTARLPGIGEPVLALGLIAAADDFLFNFNEGKSPTISVDGLAASGTVREFYPTRGRIMPGPVLRCDFKAPGGISGGPVFDQHGKVFGIVTSSMLVDGEWDTYVSLPWSAFMFEVQPEWPLGMYRQLGTLWPGHVAENWRLGIGNGEIAYFHDADPNQPGDVEVA